jgi:hypothetical protein
MTLLAGPKGTAGPSATVVGAPCFSRGELDLSPAEKRLLCKEWALALGPSMPALKRRIKAELFPATLKRCFPLLKQRAPTTF